MATSCTWRAAVVAVACGMWAVPRLDAAGAGPSADELLRLVDIAAVSLSPDGRNVAFVTRQADPDSNRYRGQLFVVTAEAGAKPRLLGDVTPGISVRSGFIDRRIGWSGDGKTLTYLTDRDGSERVWAWPVNGGTPVRVSRELDRVVSHAVVDEGVAVWFTQLELGADERERTRVAQKAYEEGMLVEPPVFWGDYLGQRGVDRFVAGKVGVRFRHWIARFGGEPREPTEEERRRHSPGFPGAEEFDHHRLSQLGVLPTALLVRPYVALAKSPDGSRLVLHVKTREGQRVSAIVVANTDGSSREEWYRKIEGQFDAVSWGRDGAVYFVQQTNDAGGPLMSLCRIAGKTESPEVVYATKGKIEFVSHDRETRRVAFVESDSVQPGRVMVFDFATGRADVLFDPNPQVREWNLPKPHLLTWENKYGVKAFGYLVPPLHRVTHRKYPLVVVTYRADGFLRGGTGDEYPVYPLAAAGFAVLVVDAGEMYGSPREGSDFSLFARYWSGLETLMAALRRADEFDFVDGSRRALTGLSYGASTGWYALTRADLFQAAIMSDSGTDPLGFALRGANPGVAHLDWFQSVFRFPASTEEMRRRWETIGTAAGVERLRAPVLINDSDIEFVYQLETVNTMRGLGKPVELHVYPDAGHLNTHPAQRRSIYRRNLDWLRFWLQGTEDADPEKHSQYERWRRLREQQRWNDTLTAEGRDAAKVFYEQVRRRPADAAEPLAPLLRSAPPTPPDDEPKGE